MPPRLLAFTSPVTSHRLLLYGILSLSAVAAVISNALNKHNNFYSIAVYLSRSNGAVIILANFSVFLALLWGRFLQQIFFGPLRPLEVERLYDRMWYFGTESMLAFTIFRDEFDTSFALWFGLVLFTKCFHWLLSDRIEWMDQRPYPGPPISFHIRTITLFTILWLVDIIAFLLTIEYMLTFGIGGTVLFTSEYAILIASLVNSFAKYCISIADLRRASLRGGENAPPWEDKSMLVFYVELATDFLKLVTYLAFFMIVLAFYGLPLNIVRDVYITARSFVMRLRDLIRYRTATRNMDERYPNATEVELNGMSDKTCIICRDEMVANTNVRPDGGAEGQNQPVAQDGPNTTPKKLPCGHIFHFYCLRSWLERQQSCPTCRRSVLETETPARANGQIPAPLAQPGAVPQAANLGPLNGQQWGQQQAPNNPGGLFGRLMGVAAVPPALPPVQNAQVQAQPHINGFAWEGQRFQGQQGQPPVYRPPFGFQGFQPRHLAQPERLQGFWAPDGVWHPWPQYPEAAPAIERGQERSSQDANTSTTQAPTSAPSEANSTNEEAEARPSHSEPSSAREAAAAAALRRLGPSTPGGQASNSRTQAPMPAASISASSQSTDQARLGTNPTEVPRGIRAPALIPLSDLSARQRGFYSRSSIDPDGYFSAENHSNLREMRNLPAQLTDEQLARLDRLSRDALDERLRVLENVHATTERCIEELLKCRSMLPRDPLEPLPQDYFTPSTSMQSATVVQNAGGIDGEANVGEQTNREPPADQEAVAEP